MSVTEAHWKASLVEKANKIAPAQAVNQAFLRQAAVSSALLTSYPAWDRYLQMLQADLDDATQSVVALQSRITVAYNDEELRMVQIQLNCAIERVYILKKCMNLPREIVTHAAQSLDKTVE